jgi:hypothetical protein
MSEVPEDVKRLTLRQMVDDFGVPEHTARFMIALEKGETQGCIVVVESQEDGTTLDSGDVAEGAAKKDQSRAAKMG